MLSVQKNGDYKGLVDPELGVEADETACPLLALSGHGCSGHGNSKLDLMGTSTILGQG
ncbi:hypothetical protein DPMN_001126 [Dreissena polymorpha]|uniref:Uncharacterized protein n=1 Tax=Dreissena polymorpha TaxID=45954 RepID=A0A9D4MHZ0_DREPO|nr:hypothetical protein DPMN_001126 [Dreissena polymorpha]